MKERGDVRLCVRESKKRFERENCVEGKSIDEGEQIEKNLHRNFALRT